jgi:predicted DNA-binding protein (UPF0251 family)
MTDITVNQPETHSVPAAKGPEKLQRLKLTRKVREAIDLMVWNGLKREEAALQVQMKDNSLYVALTRPDVKTYYLNQCEVLRTSGRARRIHRLEAMLEQDANKAAVINAALALESIGNDQASVNAQQTHSPGVVIQIINSGPTDARLTQTVIEQPKLIDVSDG